MRVAIVIVMLTGVVSCPGPSTGGGLADIVSAEVDSSGGDATNSSGEDDGDADALDTRDIAVDVEDDADASDWPFQPTAVALWTWRPLEERGRGVVINPAARGIAVGASKVYVPTVTLDTPVRTFIDVVEADGGSVGRIETWGMNAPLPVIIDDDGSLILIGQGIADTGGFNGVHVQKFTPQLELAWEANGGATVDDPVYGFQRQLAMSAGGLDFNGNVYFVVGSYLKAFDGHTGDELWQQVVVPAGSVPSTFNTAPVIIDDKIYMFDSEGSLLVLSTEGTRVLDLPLLKGQGASWMNATPDGRLVVKIGGAELVVFTVSGEEVGRIRDVGGGSFEFAFQPAPDGSLYVQSDSMFTIRTYDPALVPKWTTADLRSPAKLGMMFDDRGHLSYQSLGFEDHFIVLDRASGEVLFEKHPGVQPHRSPPVMIQDGQVVLLGRRPEEGLELRCISVPDIAVPVDPAWVTTHANFRNQRRIRSASGPTGLPPERAE